VSTLLPQGPPTTRPDSHWFDLHPQLGISMVDHLFNRLDGAYPHKWRSNFPTQQAIENWRESWVEAFEEEGITPNDIKAGLRECRTRFAWPPSCAEFMQACRPTLDPLAAYHEAVAGLEARAKGEPGEWSHPGVFWAATGMRTDLMMQTHAQIKEKWAGSLKRQMALTQWDPIPPARVLLPPPEISPASREHAAKMLATLGAIGITKTASEHFDHKRWAREILARHQRGDKTITLNQLQLAQAALDNEP
jgi:hypothetical protein